jgi:hypothetical protein
MKSRLSRAVGRRRWALFAAALLPGLLGGGGCQNMTNTDRGLLTGGALGATAGAIVGGITRHPVAGALVGGALGATAGGITGAAVDNAEHKQKVQAAAAAAVARQLSLPDVVKLTASGLSDAIIINEIRTTGSVFQLSADDVVWLQNQGVREPIIAEMQATATRPRVVYAAAPAPAVSYAEPPPPPVGVGVGIGIGGRFR